MNCFRHETAPLKAKIHLYFKMTREKIILYTLKNVINSHHPPARPPAPPSHPLITQKCQKKL